MYLNWFWYGECWLLLCLQQMSQKKQTDEKEQTKAEDSTNMNKHNANIMKLWSEQGVDKAVKQMFVHPEKGTWTSYAEMRSFYG